MYHQRQKSSSSARSDLSSRSFFSASPSPSARSISSIPSPSVHRNSLSPADTSHRRNRYKTLFFTPSIRDSGISLNAPTSDPRLPSPLTPPCFPIPRAPFQEAFIQEELDFLVDELATQFGYQESSGMVYKASDRCDSPTLGSSAGDLYHLPTPIPPTPASVWPRHGRNERNGDKKKARGPTSPLPGASHLNSPVDLSMRELAVTSRSNKTKRSGPSPRPAINQSSPLLGLPQVFNRLALTDPHINGQPIRFLSQDYVAGANSLRVGSCTFMNLPYGADVECGLRVEPSFPRTTCKTQVVMLQIVQRVVRVRDGSSVWLLCSEVDVSASFTAQVRAELSLTATSRVSGTGKQNQSDDDIWVSLAQQLQTDSYAPSTTHLPTTSTAIKTSKTTPILSDLLSLLTEIRFLHRQFFILQPRTSSQGGFMVTIPYLSSSLHTSLLSFPSSPSALARLDRSDHNFSSLTPLKIFISTASIQAKTWLQTSTTQETTILRKVLKLPKMGGNKEAEEREEEEIGIYGVRVGESWEEGRRKEGLGCWVCFLVPKGVEGEL